MSFGQQWEVRIFYLIFNNNYFNLLKYMVKFLFNGKIINVFFRMNDFLMLSYVLKLWELGFSFK